MNEITIKIEGITELTEAIKALALAFTAWRTEQTQPVQFTPAQIQYAPASASLPEQVAPLFTVPTTAPAYTLDQLAIAATQLMDVGKRNELIGLLGTYGIPSLVALTPDKYAAFANSLRTMGAKL